MGFGEERPSVAITPVESDERPCIEHPHAAGGLRRRVGGCQAVRTLAAAMSSSVIGPESASYSAMAVAKRSRPTRSAAAWAIQELTPPRPARSRTSARRSPGRVTVNLGISRFTLWSMTRVLPEMRVDCRRPGGGRTPPPCPLGLYDQSARDLRPGAPPLPRRRPAQAPTTGRPPAGDRPVVGACGPRSPCLPCRRRHRACRRRPQPSQACRR